LEGYRVIRRLGRGGMGTVYEAEHELMKKRVALKVMSPQFSQNSTAIERFMSEMVAIGKLNHPNLVRGLDARREQDRLFLIMEYLEAEDLATYRARKGPLPSHVSCDLIRQAALGLAHAHQQGIVHRDVKPLNLMVTGEGIVKVLDLGLARLENVQIATHLTSDQIIVGTPDYISPEQIRTPRDVDARADIYGLGCTLFFLLTGKSPFHQHHQAISKLLAHVNEPLKLPADIQGQIPGPLTHILERLLAKDRNLRFQSAQEVAVAIAPYCEPIDSRTERGQPTASENNDLHVTPQPETPPRLDGAIPDETRRRRFIERPLGLIAVVVGLAIAASGIMVLVETPDGTIELRLADNSLLSAIDVSHDHTITIEDPSDQAPITVSVDREKQMLRLRKEGFEVLVKQFQLNVDDQEIRVAFAPVRSAIEKLPESSGLIDGAPAEVDLASHEKIAVSHWGDWQIRNGEIVQTRVSRQVQFLMFGDPHWSEYDFSFEGRVPTQDRVHGFAGMFHVRSPFDYLTFKVGNYYNQGHEVSRFIRGKWHRLDSMYKVGTIEPDQWHTARIEVRGETARCYLNEQLLFVSHEPLFNSGQCGLATFDTQGRFRNLLVKSPDGEILWKGLPTSIMEAD